MKNYVQVGDSLELTAPAGGVVSGTAYKIGTMVVVAQSTVSEGGVFVGMRCGVFNVPTTSTPSEGQKAYFVSADSSFSTASSGNTLVGAFVSLPENGTADVLFTGQVV